MPDKLMTMSAEELKRIEATKKVIAKQCTQKAAASQLIRLVKELRLRGINTIEAANAYLPDYIADHNKRFSIVPKNECKAHRLDIPDWMISDSA